MRAAGEVRLARQWAGTGMGVRIWVGMARALVGDRERVRKKGRVRGWKGRGLGGRLWGRGRLYIYLSCLCVKRSRGVVLL